MGERIKVTDPEKLTLLFERFRDVCLVEKEVWKEIFMPREVTQGPVRTNVQDRYDVEINDQTVEDTLEANIPRGSQALAAAIQEYRANISFYRKP
jgi:DNA uptake protein ComE-like DNA-binding protein